MQESDLPEFASPNTSVQLHHREEQKSHPRLSESPEPSAAPPLPSPYHSSIQPPTLDPDFDDEESPTPMASVPQPMHSPYTQPAPSLPPARTSEEELTDQPSLPPVASTTKEESPYSRMKADVEILDKNPVITKRHKESMQSSSSKKPFSNCSEAEKPVVQVEVLNDIEASPIEVRQFISNIDSLLIDIHRYTLQTGGRVSTQLKSRISQCVSQFAVRAHNIQPPQVHSKVKKEIKEKEKLETGDPLGQLNKSIEGFSIKIARDIQRIKNPMPVTQVVSSAFLELLRDVSNVNLLCHPHRTMWEVFLYFFQQPGAAVNYIRLLPKYIKEGSISHKQIDLVKILLSEVASVDLYAIDTIGATLSLYNVATSAVGYFDDVTRAPSKPTKDEYEPGKLSKKVMTTHGKFLAKVITGTRSQRLFTPVRGKAPSPEEIPEPAVLPHPITIE